MDKEGDFEIVHLQITNEKFEQLRNVNIKPKCDISDINIIRMRDIQPSFYLQMYNEVGEIWIWNDRNNLDNQELNEIINHEDNWIYIIYFKGDRAGYFELNWRNFESQGVELVYFGLQPEYIGHGLGCYLLNYIIQLVWDHNKNIPRLYVQTCNFDHPSALMTYKKMGFEEYEIEYVKKKIPERFYDPLIIKKRDEVLSKCKSQNISYPIRHIYTDNDSIPKKFSK